MGPLMVLLVLLASTQLSHAAPNPSSASDSDRIAVQVALHDLLHSGTPHTGRGVSVSTKSVVLKEAAAKRVSDPGDAPVAIREKGDRTNDPGDAPVRQSSHSVQEKGDRTNDPGDSPIRQSSHAVQEKGDRTNDPGDSPIRQSSHAVQEKGDRTNDPGDAPVRQSSHAVQEKGDRTNDPGDAPVRQSSHSVKEAGLAPHLSQARLRPFLSKEEHITPDAIPPHYVSKPDPASTPIYVRKVTYNKPHTTMDDASVKGAAASKVRDMQKAENPAGQPWGLWNEMLDVTALMSGPGQYGEASTVGTYGTALPTPVSAPTPKVPVEKPQEPIQKQTVNPVKALSNSLRGSLRKYRRHANPTHEAGKIDYIGSDPIGADTKGADTVGASAVASAVAAAAAGAKPAAVKEAGQGAAGTVDGIYEDPSDYSMARKLKQFVNVAALNIAGVNVFKGADGKTAVDVAAPFTGVSVRKEAGAMVTSSRALKQSTVTVDALNIAGVHVFKTPDGKTSVDVAAPFTDVTVRKGISTRSLKESTVNIDTVGIAGVNVFKGADGKTAVDVAAPFTGVFVRKEAGAAAAGSRKLLDDAKTVSAASKQLDDEAEPVEAEQVGNTVPQDDARDSQAKATSSKKSSKKSKKPSYDSGEEEEEYHSSSPPAGGYYSKTGTKSEVNEAKPQSTDKPAAQDPKPAATDAPKPSTPAQPTTTKVDAAAAKPAASAAVGVASASTVAAARPAGIKSFHFATADGEGSEEKPEGVNEDPLAVKAAAAAAAVAAAEETVASAAASNAASSSKGSVSTAAAEPQGKKSASKAQGAAAVGDVVEEPKAAQPMFTKLTLTPKQVEEVRKMRAQMAASDDDEDSDILPMVAGSSKSKSKSKETPAGIASVGTAEAKPHHLPTGTAAAVEEEEEEEVEATTQAVTPTAESPKDGKTQEEDEEEDTGDEEEEEDEPVTSVKTTPGAAKDSTVAAKKELPTPAKALQKDGSSGKGQVQSVQPQAESEEPSPQSEEPAEAKDGKSTEAKPEPENKVVDKDAPRDPFFNVVSHQRPKNPLAGLFGIIRPASVQPRNNAAPRSPRKHTHKKGKHSRRSRKHDHEDLNPDLPYDANKPYATPEHPTAAGLGSSDPESFNVATAAIPTATLDASKQQQDVRPGQAFFFSAKEAGSRLAAAAAAGGHLPGSTGSSSSQDVPIEIARGPARKLLL